MEILVKPTVQGYVMPAARNWIITLICIFRGLSDAYPAVGLAHEYPHWDIPHMEAES